MNEKYQMIFHFSSSKVNAGEHIRTFLLWIFYWCRHLLIYEGNNSYKHTHTKPFPLAHSFFIFLPRLYEHHASRIKFLALPNNKWGSAAAAALVNKIRQNHPNEVASVVLVFPLSHLSD